MKILRVKSPTKAFTKVDLVIVITTIALLAVFLSVSLPRLRARSSPIQCVSNLKQIGLAFRIFANENDERYPFAVPKTTNEHTGILLTSNATTAKVWMHFQVLSNQLQSAKVLLCPRDTNRWNTAADDFLGTNTSLSHSTKRDLAVSYFIGLPADETKAQAFLAGDRNMSAGQNGHAYSSEQAGGAIRVGEASAWSDAWPTALHGTQGYVALADGSAYPLTTQQLQQRLAAATKNYGTNINLFLFPQ